MEHVLLHRLKFSYGINCSLFMRPIPSAVQAMSLTLPFSFPRGKIEDGKDNIAAL